MAFDMYFKGNKESIHYREEELFTIVSNEAGFPNLLWLWEEFYNGPFIDSQRAKIIAEELKVAKNLRGIKSSQTLIRFIERVLPFFIMAYEENERIKCLSD